MFALILFCNLQVEFSKVVEQNKPVVDFVLSLILHLDSEDDFCSGYHLTSGKVTPNSPSQDYSHPDDHNLRTYNMLHLGNVQIFA